MTGWHRDHARKALRTAFGPKPVALKRKPRPVIYDDAVMAALRKAWAVMDAPAGKRLATQSRRRWGPSPACVAS